MLGSVTVTEAWAKRLDLTSRVLGQTAGPDDAWLALRGLRTLDVRLRRHEENGLAVARWLAAQPLRSPRCSIRPCPAARGTNCGRATFQPARPGLFLLRPRRRATMRRGRG